MTPTCSEPIQPPEAGGTCLGRPSLEIPGEYFTGGVSPGKYSQKF